MTRCSTTTKQIAAAMLPVLLALPAACAAQDKPSLEQQRQLAALRARGPSASFTLFPFSLAGTASKEVAAAAGLLLEKAGLTNITIADAVFQATEDATLQQTAVTFGEFVRKNPLETDYALYGRFLGSPNAGVAAVETILADKRGAVVWTDRQTSDDKDFRRLKPDCPLTCCQLLVERLRPHLDLSGARPAGEGKLAKLWRTKSGAPDSEERAAMKQRLAKLKNAAPDVKVTVYPVRLADKAGVPEAAGLAKLLTENKLCVAQAANVSLHITVQPARNEQKVLWDMARAFRDHVTANPPDADYALYADYMLSPRDGRAMAVHFAVCNRAGRWVIVDFQNSHHDDFRNVAPKSVEDCNALVAKRLKGYLR